MTLTDSDIDFFETNGYLGPIRAWDEDTTTSFRQRLDNDLFPAPGSEEATKSSAHFKDRHLDSEFVLEIASHPSIVERMRDMMGPDLLLWTTRFFIKESGGKAFPWHQDRNYIEGALEPCINVSAWLALNDVNEENGCVRVLPGTHNRVLEHKSTGNKAFQGGLGEEVTLDELDLSTAVYIPLRPGEFFLFNENTIHGSDANRSDRPRYGLAIRVCPAHVKLNITKEGYSAIRI